MPELLQRLDLELLPAKARHDAHHQHEVAEIEAIVQGIDGRGRVQRNARPPPPANESRPAAAADRPPFRCGSSAGRRPPRGTALHSGRARKSSDARPTAGSVDRRTASTTGSPKLRLGTKWPSMMSRWSSFAPARSTRRISSPKLREIASQQRRGHRRRRRVQISKNPRTGHTEIAKMPAGNRTRGGWAEMCRCESFVRRVSVPFLQSIST